MYDDGVLCKIGAVPSGASSRILQNELVWQSQVPKSKKKVSVPIEKKREKKKKKEKLGRFNIDKEVRKASKR